MVKYPLEQLAQIKQKRLEEAERELKKKKEELKAEEEVLKKRQDELKQVLDHKADKLAQLRKELDAGTTPEQVKKMKRYLETVEEKRKIKDDAVKKQELEVEKAENAVEEARKNLIKRQADCEKLVIHKKEWEEEIRYEQKREEADQTSEMGTAMHIRKKGKKKG